MGVVLGRGRRALLSVVVVVSAGLAGSTGGGATGTAAVAGSAPPSVPVVSPSPSVSASSAAPVKPRISKAGMDYFSAIAFGGKYGAKVKYVTRWETDEVTIRVHGGNAKSRSCLGTVVKDFNAITATTDMKLTTEATADIDLYFAAKSTFHSLDEDYVSGDASFTVNWSRYHTINSAIVLIRSSGTTERDRCRMIRGELTGSMGLVGTSTKHPGSVFYARSSPAAMKYTALDKEVIGLLYSGSVYPGDTPQIVKEAVTVG
ncbi:DUF2927 domain-containing protein [Actinoplanes sp. NPDC051851]|uniref:DUF2927 domain-containing protein n=1 Tax=Actinoplanes sp. NPDC051851 TaxID=3154753 RepID=UPI00342D4A47